MKTEREIRLELIELHDCLEWGDAIIGEADKETQAKIEALNWVLLRRGGRVNATEQDLQ